jgi:hypothetical protein
MGNTPPKAGGELQCEGPGYQDQLSTLPCASDSASEGTSKLKIGERRPDEVFGSYTYRHEVVHGITYPPGQNTEVIDLMR